MCEGETKKGLERKHTENPQNFPFCSSFFCLLPSSIWSSSKSDSLFSTLQKHTAQRSSFELLAWPCPFYRSVFLLSREQRAAGGRGEWEGEQTDKKLWPHKTHLSLFSTRRIALRARPHVADFRRFLRKLFSSKIRSYSTMANNEWISVFSIHKK